MPESLRLIVAVLEPTIFMRMARVLLRRGIDVSIRRLLCRGLKQSSDSRDIFGILDDRLFPLLARLERHR